MTTRIQRHHNGKRGHHNEDGRELSTDLDGNPVVKPIRLLDIAKDGKSFYWGYFPYSWSYVKSGNQGKRDRDLHARAGYYHRRYTTAAWNMCCRNYVVHGIWGSDAVVERKLALAKLPEWLFTIATRDNNTNKVDNNVNERRKGRKDNKLQGQEDVRPTLCALFK